MNYLVYNFKKLKESNSLQSLLQVLKCQPGAGSRDQYNPHQGASDYKETTKKQPQVHNKETKSVCSTNMKKKKEKKKRG